MLLHVISYCFVFTVELSHIVCVSGFIHSPVGGHLDNFQTG